MRAVLCEAWGGPDDLVVKTVPDLQPKPGEVVVKIRAAGVNFPDVLIIQKKYQVQPELPFSPGAVISGEVTAIGEGVTALRQGDRVAALCTTGGFAEEIALDANRCIKIPESLSFEVAAGFMLAYGTSWHAVRDRAALLPSETMLVLGAAGGVGLAAVEIGKALGARVIAAASSAAKLEVCREHGADALINYDSEDLRERLKTLTEGRGVDVIYDPVGGGFTEPALRSMAWRGRLLVVGFANGQIPSIPLNLTLLKGCAIVGVFWGDFVRREPKASARDLRELLALLDAGRLKPLVSARYRFDEVAKALYAILERKVTGKIVVTP